MRKLRLIVVPALCTLLVGAILVSLGVWQLQRRAWKEGILATIAMRGKALPVALPPRSEWAALRADDYEYRRVSLKGAFDHTKETPVFRANDSGPGYLIVTPLHLDEGGTVLIDRGYVPERLKDPATRPVSMAPRGSVTVTGLMRSPEARNAFTPADDAVKDIFFTRDPAVIAAHAGLTDAAPFTIDADATPTSGGWPRGGATETAIPNNHLSYAMTWFGLALALVGVFLVQARRRLTALATDDIPSAHPSSV